MQIDKETLEQLNIQTAWVGWSLSTPGVSRKTSNGVPLYRE